MTLRIAHASDRAALQSFLTRLSPSSVQTRYLGPCSSLVGPRLEQEIVRLLHRDKRRHVVLVAVDGADIRGVGEFVVENAEHAAELGLVVEDGFQHRGIGRLLYRRLEQLARKRGLAAFTCDVHYQNRRVQDLLHRSGRPLSVQRGYGSARFTLRVDAGQASDMRRLPNSRRVSSSARATASSSAAPRS